MREENLYTVAYHDGCWWVEGPGLKYLSFGTEHDASFTAKICEDVARAARPAMPANPTSRPDPSALAEVRTDELLTYVTGWASAPSVLDASKLQHRAIETARALIADRERLISELTSLRQTQAGVVTEPTDPAALAEERIRELRDCTEEDLATARHVKQPGVIELCETTLALIDDRARLLRSLAELREQLGKACKLAEAFIAMEPEHPWSSAECDALGNLSQLLHDLTRSTASPAPGKEGGR